MLHKSKVLHADVVGGIEPYKQIEIEPVVIFSILDRYLRRQDVSVGAIGTLLGRIEDGIVSVTNCFTVPHTEENQVAVNMTFHSNMLKLHAQINPDEQIVGWYSTGRDGAVGVSMLINDFYWKEMNEIPVHVVVDTSLKGGQMKISCFYSHTVQLSNRGVLLYQFKPIRHVMKTNQDSRTLINRCVQDKEKTLQPLSDLDSLVRTVKDLLSMLGSLSAYVDSVLKEERAGDQSMALLIEETLSLIPVDPNDFEALFTKRLQDILMVVYLSNLTKSHLLLVSHSASTAAANTTNEMVISS